MSSALICACTRSKKKFPQFWAHTLHPPNCCWFSARNTFSKNCPPYLIYTIPTQYTPRIHYSRLIDQRSLPQELCEWSSMGCRTIKTLWHIHVPVFRPRISYTMLQRPKRGETVHWSSKQCKGSLYALPGHSVMTGEIDTATCCACTTRCACTWVQGDECASIGSCVHALPWPSLVWFSYI